MSKKPTPTELYKKAWDHLEKDGLSPTPANYELLYLYYQNERPDLVHAVEIAITARKKLTDTICMEIHQRFLGDSRNEEAVMRAGDQISETVKQISAKVHATRQATEEYSTKLVDISSRVDQEKDAGNLGNMLKSVVAETKSILERNAELEKELGRSTEVMAILQKDLEHVRKEAITDSLTTLANRKAFDMELERIALEAEKSGEKFTLLMIDIDHFKNFNDNFGHQVGDQVLRLVARTLKECVRGKDVVARYGGEEFAVILPSTPLSAGISVGNNLRHTVAGKEVVNRITGEYMGQITISVGVAERGKSEGLDNLISRADEALYTAKNEGRNRVASAVYVQDKSAKQS